MIQFFRRIRRNQIMSNDTSKYIKYAIGEILLVVIGILIALQIDNWNEQRIENNQIKKVHERIMIDIDDDIYDLRRVVSLWKGREPVFNKVISDSITADLLDLGLSRILTGPKPYTNLNKSGVEQLKAMNVKDQLSLNIIEVYDLMENFAVIPYEKSIDEASDELVDIFRDNYAWYPEYMSKTIMQDNSSKELQDYFLHNPEYRHRIIAAYQIIYVNYVPFLESYIGVLERLSLSLKKKYDDNFIEINKEELEQYAGTYKVSEIQGLPLGMDLGIQINELGSIDAYSNYLRLSPIKDSLSYIDLFYKGGHTFYSNANRELLTFEKGDDNSFQSFTMTLEATGIKVMIKSIRVNDVTVK